MCAKIVGNDTPGGQLALPIHSGVENVAIRIVDDAHNLTFWNVKLASFLLNQD